MNFVIRLRNQVFPKNLVSMYPTGTGVMKNWLYFTLTAFIMCLLSSTLTSEAIYEGTANANIMIRRYERRGEFGKAALWREAAAKCLDVISIPLGKITIEYCQGIGNAEFIEHVKAEIEDAKIRRDEHLRRAKMNWEKAKENKRELDAERAKIDKFIAEWVPHYPDRFYKFGIYNNVFKKRIYALREQGKFDEALLVEARASDMCARQYEDLTIKYFQDKAKVEHAVSLLVEAYQKVRDKHLKRSAMLRVLAKQNPKSWPAEADKKDFNVPQSKHKLTTDKVLNLARADKRIQEILKEHEEAMEFAWFQGFGWTVSYYTHGWENLGIAFVDDETGTITDVLTSPGDLEEREWDEEEKEGGQKLRLSPEKVIEIAKKNLRVKNYFKKHPDAKAYATYNWRYNCWIMEVVLNNREVGIVSVSDKTEEVLEVTVPQLSSDKDSTEWTVFRGNVHRSGKVDGFAGPQEGQEIWSFREPLDRAGFSSSPAVVGERVYVGANNNTLYCFNAATGDVVWKFETSYEVFSSPAVLGDKVYFGEGLHYTEDANFYCVDANTGKNIWSFSTSSHTESSPSVTNGKVIFGAGDDGVYCLDSETGSKLWQYPSIHVDGSPAVYDNKVYFGSGYGRRGVYCLDLNDGSEIWTVNTRYPAWGAPAVWDNKVYIGTGAGNFAVSTEEPAGSMLCLDAGTGKKLWEFEVSDTVLSAIAINGGRAYFGSRDSNLYCVNVSSGELIWEFAADSAIVSSPAVVMGDVYFGSDSGKIYCLYREDGIVKWEFDTSESGLFNMDSRIIASPAISGGKLFIGSMNCFFYCIGDE